jgi:DNA processing protein
LFDDLFGLKSNSEYSEEEIDILRLIRSENVGTRSFLHLINACGSVASAIERAPELSLRGGRSKPIKIFSKDKALAEIEAISKIGAKLLFYNSKSYPMLLQNIPDFPPVLSYKGNIELLKSRKIVAMVGARNSSINAKILAGKIASDLVAQEYVTVSGLARGIDTTVHEASGDNTIAVIAGGIDHIYPPENKLLFQKISQNGLLLAELPVGSSPLAKHFPQRNRIIAGMALATVVIEASLKSGSLITANFALEYNRDVFAVPGFPLDPRCIGSNKLIKEGAYLLESSEDIFTHFTNIDSKKEDFPGFNNNNDGFRSYSSIDNIMITDNDRNEVVNLLSVTPVAIERLSSETNLSLPVIYTICLELELAGRIVRYPGNKIALVY